MVNLEATQLTAILSTRATLKVGTWNVMTMCAARKLGEVTKKLGTMDYPSLESVRYDTLISDNKDLPLESCCWTLVTEKKCNLRPTHKGWHIASIHMSTGRTGTSVEMLYPLFMKICEKNEVPAEWKKGYLSKLPKKGDLSVSCSHWLKNG